MADSSKDLLKTLTGLGEASARVRNEASPPPGGSSPSRPVAPAAAPARPAAPAPASPGVVPLQPAAPSSAAASATTAAAKLGETKLEELLKKFGHLAQQAVGKPGARPAPASPEARPSAEAKRFVDGDPLSAIRESHGFIPHEPESFQAARLTNSQVEALILKYLLARGDSTGREVTDQVKLPFKQIDELLGQMKSDQLVVYTSTAVMGDYTYRLTDMGRERARRCAEECTYFGSAPVDLQDYIASVKAQSLTGQHPTVVDLERAFEDLLINKRMLDRLGPAINSGRGLFLYGAAGNGKTSIAERITKAFGDCIWIPRAISVDGEIIRLFDPSNHEAMPLEKPWNSLIDQFHLDRRWIRIRRPTIVVGGELTMDNLEVTINRTTGISEAPLQMKSNCGTLVIDDFGRQRMSVDELLNRWIVPLEKRYDFLNLPNGKKIQVPFDQLIVFSTNLEPKDLVDDAFLRRIPYKIDVQDPSEQEFRALFQLMAPKLGMEFHEPALNYLIETHYRPTGRPFRCCQPRDLLMQIRNFCLYRGATPEMTPQYMDFAVENYFAVM